MKSKFIFCSVALAVILGGTMTSCSSDKDYGFEIGSATLIQDLQLNVGSQLPLAVGMEKQITATITNSDAEYTDLKWDSTTPDVATVDENGKVVAKSLGTTTIQISSPYEVRVIKSVTVNVMPAATALSMEDFNLYVNTSKTVSPVTTPANAYNVFKWTSSDESVMTVDEDGTVHGVAPGTATLTAQTLDGSNLTATANVTVKEVVALQSVKLHTLGHDMMIGEKAQIKADILPSDATPDLLKWESSNTDVATVDGSGIITAKGAGTATIKASDQTDGSTISGEVTVTVAANGVISTDMAYMKSTDDLKQIGWSIGTSPKTVEFVNGGVKVEPSQTSGKRRADFIMSDASHPVYLNVGTYRYMAIMMDRPGNGALKLDTNKGDYGNDPTGTLDASHKVYYWDLQSKNYFPTDGLSDKLTTFQIKIADITVEPYGYTIYWVHTFKTLDDLNAFIEQYK